MNRPEASTGAERACLEQLRAAAGATDGPMERHCLRVDMLARAMAAERGVSLDEETLLCAALLHDIGLYPAASRGGVYTDDGAELARELLAPLGWSSERIELCADAISQHHALRSQSDRGIEVELLRCADLTDVSAGLVPHGLPRTTIREIFATVPRSGTYRHIGSLVGRALRERPVTVPQIFKLH